MTEWKRAIRLALAAAALAVGATAAAAQTYTLLHSVATEGTEREVRALAKNGWDPNAKDSDGNTPLHRAAFYGNAAAVRALLEARAGPNAVNEFGETPMALAGYASGDAEAVMRALHEAGADPAPLQHYWYLLELEPTQHSIYKTVIGPLLHGLAFDGNVAAVRYFLDQGRMDPNGEEGDGNGNTPLHAAALAVGATAAAQAAVMRALLEAGADPNVENSSGNTPLHGAAYSGSGLAVRALLEAGADPNAKDGDGDTPLRYAEDGGHAVAAALLREAGGKL